MSNAQEAVRVPEKTISVGGREFVVRPFSFDQRLKIYELITEAVAAMGSVKAGNLSGDTALEILPALMRVAAPKLKGIFAGVLGETEDWVGKNLDALGEADLIEAIAEVNDFPLYLSRMKAAFGKLRQKFASSSASPDTLGKPQEV